MKIVPIVLCLTVSLLPVVLCQDDQKFPAAILSVVVPCAQETGQDIHSLKKIMTGDFESIRNLFGCFADCVSKKVGIVSADNVFQAETFKKQLGTFLRDEQIQEYSDRCTPRAGTEECKVSGHAYACLIFSILGTMYA